MFREAKLNPFPPPQPLYVLQIMLNYTISLTSLNVVFMHMHREQNQLEHLFQFDFFKMCRFWNPEYSSMAALGKNSGNWSPYT